MGNSGKSAGVTGAQQKGSIACALASSVVFLCGSASIAQAQMDITPDGTLGSQPPQDAIINGLPSERINGGTMEGSNLFHSFSEFNINAGQRIYFANPIGITDILSRVTGTDISDINGLLGVEGAANLFLLNPNGVVFGPEAELDLNGSFTVSTAESISFDGNQAFGISTPADGLELLTFSTPLGVQFNDQPQGNITIQGDLAVDAGQSIELLGNSILLEDTLLNVDGASLIAPGGTIQLLGNQIGLDSQATVNVNGGTDDSTVTIAADEIDLAPGSSILGTGNLVLQPLAFDNTVILGGTTVPLDITTLDLNASDLAAINDGFSSITIGQENLTGNIILDGNVAFSDPLALTTSGTIIANENSSLTASNNQLTLKANEMNFAPGTMILGTGELILQPLSSDQNIVLSGLADTDNTNLDLTTTDLDALNDGFSNITLGQANSNGSLTLAGDTVFSDPTTILSSSILNPNRFTFTGVDNASLTFPGDLTSPDGLNISTDADVVLGNYTGRDFKVNTTGSIVVNSINASSFDGNGGFIMLTAGDNVNISDFTNTSAGGNNNNSGALTINAEGTVTLGDNGFLFAHTGRPTGMGIGGAVEIEGSSININGTIDPANLSGIGGETGDTTITSTSGDIILSDGIIYGDIGNDNPINPNANNFSGEGGEIKIDSANNIVLSNYALESTYLGTAGIGGDTSLIAAQNIRIEDSGITTKSTNGGNAGTISVRTINGSISIIRNNSQFSQNNSSILSDATGGGNAGDIAIISGIGGTTLNSTNISSESDGGDLAGNIFIESNGGINIVGNDNSISTDATNGGLAGFINIDSGIDGTNIDSVNISSESSSESDGESFNFSGAIVIKSDGGINITGNGNSISADATGEGLAGFIEINSGIDGATVSGVDISSESNGGRSAGFILFRSDGSISIIGNNITDNNSIRTSAVGGGSAGFIEINSSGNITLDRVDLFSSVESGGSGENAGNISINSNSDIDITNNVIRTDTTGGGVAGNIDINSGDGFTLIDSSTISSRSEGEGEFFGSSAGAISIRNGGLLLGNSSLTTDATGGGFAGFIDINSGDGFTLIDSSTISSRSEGGGFFGGGAGNISIRNSELLLFNSSLTTDATDGGFAGFIDIDSGDGLTRLDSSDISSRSEGGFFGGGAAGIISSNSGGLQLSNESAISTNASDGASSGLININSSGGVILDNNSSIAANAEGDAPGAIAPGAIINGGTINILADFLSLTNNSSLDANFGGSGEASNITITTTGVSEFETVPGEVESFGVFLNDSTISAIVEPEATQSGGAITINTDSIALTNGTLIQTQTRGNTDAGDVILNVNRLIDIQGANEESRLNSGINVSPLQSATGDGGSILINRPESPRGTLNISDNGFLAALTQSDADAGNIEINVENLNLETGGQIIAVSTSTGEAGSIEINALGEVFISGQGSGSESFQSPFSDEANLTALEFGTTADINFETLEGASFASDDAPENGGFAYFSFRVTQPNSQGIFDIDGADIDTEIFLFEQSTGALLATNDDDFRPLVDAGSNSSLDSFLDFTFAESGEYVIGVGEFNSSVLNDELISGVAPQAGTIYDLNISLQNAANGLTDVTGANPNPNQAVTDQAQVFNSGLFASTSGEGPGGDITINIGESEETTTSTGGGVSFIGNTVNGTDQPTLVLDDGGTISALTSGGGPGGNIIINSQNNPLRIQGDGQLTVSSTEANSGPSGDIDINVGALALLDGVQINATNASLAEEGGDITIVAPDGFVMLDFSNLSTDRGNVIIAESTNPDGGRGGDITITTNEFFFTIPEQNNDIIANAVGGTGGDITITANRIFGFLLRTALDTQALRTNNTSDISARSEIGIPGVVDLINLSFDPAQGLNELALNLSNATEEIAEGCRANVSDTEQSEFVSTGRGGLPSSPSDPLAAELESVPWVTAPDTDTTTATVSVTPHQSSLTAPLLEAQGWVETNGETFFVADPPTNPSPQVSSIPTASLCSVTVDK